MHALHCQNVEKKFDHFSALKGVSLHVQAGECFGLLGPNGAGKSTLISLIYGAGAISSGTISVFGKNPQTQGREIRANLGVVTQDNNLDTSMSVVENMQIFSRFVGLPREKRPKRIDELLDFMQLSHKKHAVIESLSGGMQRRLAFVRALLNSPQLIILDEPTTGLDPAVRQLLWDKVKELKASGTTILLTTHYMDEAEQLCDRLVIMSEGLVQAEGRPSELIQKHYPGFVAIFNASQTINGLEGKGVLVEKEGERVILRSERLEQLMNFISEQHLKPLAIRPANLEDVFLKITGKELRKND